MQVKNVLLVIWIEKLPLAKISGVALMPAPFNESLFAGDIQNK